MPDAQFFPTPQAKVQPPRVPQVVAFTHAAPERVFPAVVALHTLGEHHPEFGLLLLTDAQALSEQDAQRLRSSGIEVLDTGQVASRADALPEALYEWMVPHLLAERGVRFSLRVAPDMVFLQSMNPLKQPMRSGHPVAYARRPVDYRLQGAHRRQVREALGISVPKRRRPEHSVVLFRSSHLRSRLPDIYATVLSVLGHEELAMEAAVDLMLTSYGKDAVHHLPGSVAHRADGYIKGLQPKEHIRGLVAPSSPPPWEPLSTQHIRHATMGRASVSLAARDVWLTAASGWKALRISRTNAPRIR
ncbi:hypothetical protein [Nesterenkonia sp. NBAIMH1]|uniref:hypothetical protein n=1 Tax=Nesterenkonia sp. NBAIMH1 TaxID=2600320 RepID=UPI0011B48C9B|nr:hypothetical protein [Nesterenkonia sp. NBAIMH1]